MGEGMAAYEKQPLLGADNTLAWVEESGRVTMPDVLRSADNPFTAEGGLRCLTGNLGESICKISAVKPEHRIITAPCLIFDSQTALKQAFERGELARDFVAVVRFQGPGANGMPELHQLTPSLGALLDQGYKVALVTDGRMSGASGKVPAAIHVCPEAVAGGALARLQDGDLITVDSEQGQLFVHLSDEALAARIPAQRPVEAAWQTLSLGRDLFSKLRNEAGAANRGASFF
jgi:phosphogluconate dehydratase